MYRYDEFDHRFVTERVAEFRDQVARRLTGALNEAEFKPLRLMNGLYLQLHAYMLRVAIPYGTLSARQMRMLAHIAEKWDKGYGHFTTRQNIQYNWPRLSDVPDILEALASVEMHAIQTSGNCIRNVTSDPYSGVASEEVEDPRITAEMLRQWSSLHPEFTYLGRKFKFAVTGSQHDRAAIKVHDIGIQVVRNDAGEVGYRVLVGGGLGRTPMIGKELRTFLPRADLLPYVEAALRVYNLHGRRDTARQQIQGADQDPGPRDRHRGIPRPGRARVRHHGPRRRRRARGRDGTHRRLFRPAGTGRKACRPGRVRADEDAGPGLRPVGRAQHLPAQGAGPCRRDDLAEAHRRRAGRRHRRADAGDGGSGRELFGGRVADHPRAERGAAACGGR
jgi:hypothetical protein